MDAARTEFRRVMHERRAHAPGSLDHAYRTVTARRLVWLMRGIPANNSMKRI
jgi:hypothetical protein